MKVRVEGIGRIVNAAGTRSSDIHKMQEEIPEAESVKVRRRIAQKTPGFATCETASNSSRTTALSKAAQVFTPGQLGHATATKAPREVEPPAASSEEGRGGDKKCPDRPRSPTAPSARSMETPPSKKKQRVSKAPAQSLSELPAADADMDPADFFMRQEAVINALSDAKKEFVGRDSYLPYIKTNIKKLAAEVVKKMKPNPSEVVTKLERLVCLLDEAMVGIQTCGQDELAQKEANGFQALRALQAEKADAIKAYSGVKFQIGKITTNKRKSYMQNYHKHKKARAGLNFK